MVKSTTPKDFENTPATLEQMGGTRHMLKVDGEPMFRTDWHHSPKDIGDDWYRITKGVGYIDLFVKITENVARHPTTWEKIVLNYRTGQLNIISIDDRLPFTPNTNAQIK